MHQLREVNLPEDMAELVPSANPDFYAKEVFVRLSSPVKPEATWRLDLLEPFSFSQIRSAGVTWQANLQTNHRRIEDTCQAYMTAVFDFGTGVIHQSEQTQKTTMASSKSGDVNHAPNSDFICTRSEAESADGTKIPITLCHQRGLELSGTHPALLHAYGAYGMCLDAGFKPERLSLLKRGYAQYTSYDQRQLLMLSSKHTRAHTCML